VAGIVTRFDPLSYIVDPMRHAVFSHLSIPGAATASIAPGITWNGWEVPDGLSLGIVAVIGVAMLFLAIAQFRKTE
jgi:ABC-2 type transport system permease protein